MEKSIENSAILIFAGLILHSCILNKTTVNHKVSETNSISRTYCAGLKLSEATMEILD